MLNLNSSALFLKFGLTLHVTIYLIRNIGFCDLVVATSYVVAIDLIIVTLIVFVARLEVALGFTSATNFGLRFFLFT